MNLPQDFLNYLIQNQALNPIAQVEPVGSVVASNYITTSVTATGTTFATGADLLNSDLEFTAQGNRFYIVRCVSPGWKNNTATDTNFLSLKLDSAEGGYMAVMDVAGVSYTQPLNAQAYIQPSGGKHSVNVRLWVSGGTGTVNAGSGGVGGQLPCRITIEVA